MSSDQDESLFSVTLGSERLECVSCFVDTEVSRCSRDVSKFIELSLQSSLIVVFSNKASKWFFRYLIASENTFKAGSFFPFCALSFNYFNFCFVICKKKLEQFENIFFSDQVIILPYRKPNAKMVNNFRKEKRYGSINSNNNN